MNNTFQMLENLAENLPDVDKFDSLYKALPASLRITTNIIAY